jgi:hypothetical protein
VLIFKRDGRGGVTWEGMPKKSRNVRRKTVERP